MIQTNMVLAELRSLFPDRVFEVRSPCLFSTYMCPSFHITFVACVFVRSCAAAHHSRGSGIRGCIFTRVQRWYAIYQLRKSLRCRLVSFTRRKCLLLPHPPYPHSSDLGTNDGNIGRQSVGCRALKGTCCWFPCALPWLHLLCVYT